MFVSQNISLLVLVCVRLTDMVCVLRNSPALLGQASRRRTWYASTAIWPKVFKLSVCGDRPVSTAQIISLLLWACVCATDMVCVPVDKAQDHEPKVCGDLPVSVAQNDSLLVLVCVRLTDKVCVLRNKAQYILLNVCR